MSDTHSVSWTRQMSVAELAKQALTADELVVYHGDIEDDYSQLVAALARDRRRIALDELVRRGAIESYSFV